VRAIVPDTRALAFDLMKALSLDGCADAFVTLGGKSSSKFGQMGAFVGDNLSKGVQRSNHIAELRFIRTKSSHVEPSENVCVAPRQQGFPLK
jgi:hypothetical protein